LFQHYLDFADIHFRKSAIFTKCHLKSWSNCFRTVTCALWICQMEFVTRKLHNE
jgi:hypothetical protein